MSDMMTQVNQIVGNGLSFLQSTVIPVSYTHLDVYKRQDITEATRELKEAVFRMVNA